MIEKYHVMIANDSLQSPLYIFSLVLPQIHFHFSINNPNERESLKQQILEFGQTPKQLFTQPHPHRKVAHFFANRRIVSLGMSFADFCIDHSKETMEFWDCAIELLEALSMQS